MGIKNSKLKTKNQLLYIFGVIFLVIAIVYSASWVIAETAKSNVVTNKPETAAQKPVVSEAAKYSIGVGRPDPFIPVTGAAGASFLPGEVTGGKEGMVEGASQGVVLTGILFLGGKSAVILKTGTKSFIAKLGERKFGYYVKSVGKDKVVLSTKSGDITVPLMKVSYLSGSKQAPSFMPTETNPPGGGNLIPPPMQPPVEEKSTKMEMQVSPAQEKSTEKVPAVNKQ